MSDNAVITRDQAIDANIAVHSALANSGEYNRSPHFRPENKDKVRCILENLVEKTPSDGATRLLDMGCGTGFIIELVKDLVTEVYGVDVTEDMMKQVDLSSGNISLKISTAENTGFDDEYFDLVTAYSFLDHLLDYRVVLEEAYRVLKPGGVFYADLNPNRSFTLMMEHIEQKYPPNVLPFSISREIKSMLHNGELYEDDHGIPRDTLINAEPGKSYEKGFDVTEIREIASELGFRDVVCEYDWFLGEGVIKNSESTLNLEDINAYLTQMLPATESFYKYLRFVFYK